MAFSNLTNEATSGNSLMVVAATILFTRSLAVSSFFFDDKLLPRVSINFACCYQLMGLHDLLLLVFLQSFLALV